MMTAPRLEVPRFVFPEPLRATTYSGATILLLPMENATTVSIAVFARAGVATEPQPGVAHMTASLLVRGTRKRSEAELARAIDRLGATQQVLSLPRSIGLTTVGLPEHFEQIAALTAECILEPAFDEAEFAKVKLQTLDSFPVVLSDSAYRARRIFQKLRFGDHPLSRPTLGTPRSVQALQPEQVRSWYYDHVLRNVQWYVMAIGKFDSSAAQCILEGYFRELPGGSTEQLTEPTPPQEPAIGIGQGVFTEQVELRLGHRAVPYTSPHYAAAFLIATAFVGHFRSRINLLVREREGLTYGAYGALHAGRHTGTFVLATSTTPEHLPRMLELLHTEWHRLHREPLTNDELLQARQYLYGSFWRSVETPESIAALAVDLALHELPPDYYNQLLAAIEQQTPQSLLPVQQEIFDPHRLLIAAVGDCEQLQSTLAPYGTLQHIMLEEEQQ